ncbi:MAG TPA: 4Fe-4S dicluster domain-containing protein, partial [Nitrososphaerales archaeon]|nr:4Fe-4S dicluster domain-containing protein [Nitrososphaerales archaeon]
YRQFVTHKFGYWPEQFGHFGCVGCGRCITWCPVGIDITETVNAVVKGHVAAGKGGREAQIV